MKKLLLLFLFFSINVYAKSYSNYSSIDPITVNSLEYNKTRIKILKPCILNKNKPVNEETVRAMNEAENVASGDLTDIGFTEDATTTEVKDIDDILDNIEADEKKNTTTPMVYKTSNIEEISNDDLYSYYNDEDNIIETIYKKLLNNLEKTNLYEIEYDIESCENINRFFIDHNTKDISEYILSDELVYNSYVLSTDIEILNENEIKLQILLWDTLEQRFLSGKYYIINTIAAVYKDSYSKAADMMADFVFQTTTGEQGGLFDSKIIYVSETGDVRNRNKQINIMNFDGTKNARITHGNNMKLTPIFSRYNPNEVFYIEYTKDGVFVVKHDLKTGTRARISAKGQDMTSAASFNPSGENQLIVAGSEENKGTNLFLFDLEKRTNRRITNNKAINTAASFSPDGKQVVYVSDKIGGRKLFVKNLETGEETMISAGNGIYDKPAWSPDGRLIAFVKILKGRFYLGIMTTTGDGERYLTSDYLLEGVKWSPNSRYLIYTKQKGAFGKDSIPKIYVMDIVTRNEYQLNTPKNEGASDPDWIMNN